MFDLVLPKASRTEAIIKDCNKKGLRKKRVRKANQKLDQTSEHCIDKTLSNEMATEPTRGRELNRDDVRLRTKKKNERENVNKYGKDNNNKKKNDKKLPDHFEQPSVCDADKVWRLQHVKICGANARFRPKTTNVSEGNKAWIWQENLYAKW